MPTHSLAEGKHNSALEKLHKSSLDASSMQNAKDSKRNPIHTALNYMNWSFHSSTWIVNKRRFAENKDWRFVELLQSEEEKTYFTMPWQWCCLRETVCSSLLTLSVCIWCVVHVLSKHCVLFDAFSTVRSRIYPVCWLRVTLHPYNKWWTASNDVMNFSHTHLLPPQPTSPLHLVMDGIFLELWRIQGDCRVAASHFLSLQIQ